jgi:hypothetical protein
VAINAAPHGAELFLADPFRFLGEHGFTIPPALQAQPAWESATGDNFW